MEYLINIKMNQNIKTNEITDKEKLNELIKNLNSEAAVIINIEKMYSFKFLKNLRDSRISYSRIGFKKWLLSKNEFETNKKIVYFRLICFGCVFVPLFFWLIFKLIPLWKSYVEFYVAPFPFGSQILLIIFVTIIGFFLKRFNIFARLKKFVYLYGGLKNGGK